MIKAFIVALVLLAFAGCSTRGVPRYTLSSASNGIALTKNGRTHPTMRPYTIHGKTYYPTVVKKGETFDGRASWYGPNFDGKLTSSGERYNMYEATAAHKTLPMNTIVRVTNKDNGKQTVVRINDRGPFVASRIIDLSKKAAQQIGMIRKGTANVHLEILGFAGAGERNIPSEAVLAHSPNAKVVSSFYVQIGSFRRFAGAALTQEKYDGFQGHHTIIKDTEYNNARLFRVWLGTFKSENEARDFIANASFSHAFIVRE